MIQADNDVKSPKVIVNVGCNKASDAVEWLHRWDSARWNLPRWLPVLPPMKGFACPLSEKTVPPVVAQGAGTPRAVCIEAMPKTAAALKTALAKYLLPHSNDTELATQLDMVHAAVSNEEAPGLTVDFPDSAPGTEAEGMNQSEGGPTRPVLVRTVDSLVKERALPKVDILIIDTEGADPLVLQGSTDTLKSVRYLEFEVHRDLVKAAWSQIKLRSVMDGLADFDCYWAGNQGSLYPVMECWEDTFENGCWSNIVCARKTDVWSRVLRSRAMAHADA
ncbi:unnamed protein product [Polarella glacialis]|uniref:Methyltransferase FkbM domain-containing protein n=1 Tax=Polarella glacialis TaxID=89957 RepID=A0A813DSZ4_POLGL|nr:unnamed protein product [Polarella glacialis]